MSLEFQKGDLVKSRRFAMNENPNVILDAFHKKMVFGLVLENSKRGEVLLLIKDQVFAEHPFWISLVE